MPETSAPLAPSVVGSPRFQRLRVLFALVVREMGTRFGRAAGGYLWRDQVEGVLRGRIDRVDHHNSRPVRFGGGSLHDHDAVRVRRESDERAVGHGVPHEPRLRRDDGDRRFVPLHLQDGGGRIVGGDLNRPPPTPGRSTL